MTGLSRYGLAGDVRGFYAALGLQLPAHARGDVAVRCFADRDAHARGDRDPSCSISLTSGAWACHGCGARGGAYDAALARGRSAREAIDLMVVHGLTERRSERPPPRPRRRAAVPPRPAPVAPDPLALAIPEAQLRSWAAALQSRPALLERLARERAWSSQVLADVGAGWDGWRVTLPARDGDGRLVALLRYAPPWARRGPKLLAARGSRRALFPSPAALAAPQAWLLEGQPDALAALSLGLAAVAIPGVWGWQARWAPLFADRDVVICFDCDPDGRAAARRAVRDLVAVARAVRILDLDPSRDDGWDLTDAILAAGPGARAQLLERAAAAAPLAAPLAGQA